MTREDPVVGRKQLESFFENLLLICGLENSLVAVGESEESSEMMGVGVDKKEQAGAIALFLSNLGYEVPIGHDPAPDSPYTILLNSEQLKSVVRSEAFIDFLSLPQAKADDSTRLVVASAQFRRPGISGPKADRQGSLALAPKVRSTVPAELRLDPADYMPTAGNPLSDKELIANLIRRSAVVDHRTVFAIGTQAINAEFGCGIQDGMLVIELNQLQNSALSRALSNLDIEASFIEIEGKFHLCLTKADLDLIRTDYVSPTLERRGVAIASSAAPLSAEPVVCDIRVAGQVGRSAFPKKSECESLLKDFFVSRAIMTDWDEMYVVPVDGGISLKLSRELADGAYRLFREIRAEQIPESFASIGKSEDGYHLLSLTIGDLNKVSEVLRRPPVSISAMPEVEVAPRLDVKAEKDRRARLIAHFKATIPNFNEGSAAPPPASNWHPGDISSSSGSESDSAKIAAAPPAPSASPGSAIAALPASISNIFKLR